MTDATPRMGVSVVVLAGGRSSRFGSPKLEATLDGRPLLDHVLELARAISDDVVVAGSGSGAAAGSSEPVGRTVRDPEAFGGPLVGLASALEAVDRAVVVVLAGDMPRMGIEILQPMLIVLGQDEQIDAVVLERDGEPRPLPLVLRTEPARSAAKAIREGSGERSLRALVAALHTNVIDEAHWRPLDPTGQALADIDRPADLAALENRD
jgi:molybdopterin-guanine dinucleotide biosynthesis protein A